MHIYVNIYVFLYVTYRPMSKASCSGGLWLKSWAGVKLWGVGSKPVYTHQVGIWVSAVSSPSGPPRVLWSTLGASGELSCSPAMQNYVCNQLINLIFYYGWKALSPLRFQHCVGEHHLAPAVPRRRPQCRPVLYGVSTHTPSLGRRLAKGEAKAIHVWYLHWAAARFA